eukprot:750184-Hanusia_phi.AAC.4
MRPSRKPRRGLRSSGEEEGGGEGGGGRSRRDDSNDLLREKGAETKHEERAPSPGGVVTAGREFKPRYGGAIPDITPRKPWPPITKTPSTDHLELGATKASASESGNVDRSSSFHNGSQYEETSLALRKALRVCRQERAILAGQVEGLTNAVEDANKAYLTSLNETRRLQSELEEAWYVSRKVEGLTQELHQSKK